MRAYVIVLNELEWNSGVVACRARIAGVGNRTVIAQRTGVNKSAAGAEREALAPMHKESFDTIQYASPERGGQVTDFICIGEICDTCRYQESKKKNITYCVAFYVRKCQTSRILHSEFIFPSRSIEVPYLQYTIKQNINRYIARLEKYK